MKNPKGRINKALYFFAGGGSAPTIGNPSQGPQTFAQNQPQLQQAFDFNMGNFNQFQQNQPLLGNVQSLIDQVSSGAQGFFGQMFGPNAPAGGVGQGISNAQYEIGSGGYATPEQQRDTNQGTLTTASGLGSAFSPNTLGQLAINSDQARQQRVNTAYGQLGSAQGLQTGALNQLLGAASGAIGGLQGEVGAYTGLTDPAWSFISNQLGQNTQAQIAQLQASTQQELANQSKNAGFINSGISSIGSIAGGLAMASDERLKKDIRDTGMTKDGVPLKTFEYKTRPGTVYLGVLAQDVEKVAPESVIEDERSGIKLVDAERFPIFPIHFAGKAA